MDVAVVVAFRAKIPGVPEVFARLAEVLDAIPDQRWSFIAVFGDASGTAWREAQTFAADHPEMRLMEGGLQDGVAVALQGFDVIVTMDSTDPAEPLPELIAAVSDADVAVGVRRGVRLRGGLDGLLQGMLTGGRIDDPSSSLQVFRAEAARGLRFDESPAGILAQAHDAGLDVSGVPVEGQARALDSAESGWALWKRHWAAREARLVVLLILLGLGLFFLWSYPVARYHIDSDGVLAGMCGEDVLHGRQWPFFPGGFRLGSGSCYLSAVVIALFGDSRSVYPLVTFVYASVFLALLYFALNAALGRSAAVAGLIVAAFPPLQYMFFISPPTPYGEMMASIALCLWLGFVLLFQPAMRSKWMVFAFGLSLGYSFWVSPESLMVIFPLAVFVLIRRVLAVGDYAVLAAGGALGLFSYIYLTLTRGALFLGEFAAQPAKGWQPFVDNLEYLITFVLPLFLFDTAGSIKAWSPVQGLALLLLVVAFALTVRVAWVSMRKNGWSEPGRLGLTAMLTVAIVIASLILFSVSGAGGVRGWTTRYIAPIYVAVPLMASILYASARRQGMQSMVIACAVALAILNSSNHRILAHPDRQISRQDHINGQRSWDWLRAQNRDVVMGDYWLVYRLNYGYGKGITFLPAPMFFDYLFLKERLPSGKPVRLALMHTDAAALQAWAARAGVPGRMEPVPGGFAFLIDGEVDPKRLDAIAAVRG